MTRSSACSRSTGWESAPSTSTSSSIAVAPPPPIRTARSAFRRSPRSSIPATIRASAVGAGDPTGGFLPIFYFPGKDLALGVFYVVLLGFVAGAIPAFQAMRLRIVDALRRG